MILRNFAITATLIACFYPVMASGGPQSEFYLNAANQRAISVVQGDAIVRSWSTLIPSPSNAFGIAVMDTVRTASGAGGVEYTLGGTPTGVIFPGWTLPPQVFDGATDGSYNYTWDFTFGGVYRHELDWTNPVLLFTAEGKRIGITFDTSNNSLWLADWNEQEADSSIENYSLDGTLLSSFAVPVAAVMALAMDYADSTLWFGTQADLNDPVRTLYQYSRAGELLSTSAYAGISGLNYLGGEFALKAAETEVAIDIKPGNKTNVINPRAKGDIWVAILADTDPTSPFDPSSQVDIPTVEFGPDGAKAIRHKVKDINKDGLGDLLLRFEIPQTGIACRDTDATLTGETFDGQSFTGTDSIKTVGCKP